MAHGALADAGLSKDDVDGYFCAGDAPGLGGLSMADYMGLRLRHIDTTETGGSSYVVHVAHASEAIAAGRCDVALITLAGRPRAEGMATGTAPRNYGSTAPDGSQSFLCDSLDTGVDRQENIRALLRRIFAQNSVDGALRITPQIPHPGFPA